MAQFLKWLVERIQTLSGEGYQPAIHLDTKGELGRLHQNQLGQVLGQLYAWEYATKPYRLRVEDPIVLETLDAHMDAIKTLGDYIRIRKMDAQLVANHWVDSLQRVEQFIDAQAGHMLHLVMPILGGVQNAVQAVLTCKAHGMGVLLGGSAAESDLSARVTAHVAVATQPDLVLAKPGTGVDEAVSIIQNEMARTLATIETRQ
jgi:methylaspartate ammonia-lyase